MNKAEVRLPWWDLVQKRMDAEGQLKFLQVQIRSAGGVLGYEMREAGDWERPREDLKELRAEDLRDWARFDERGGYRMLRSAPDLRPGWRVQAAGVAEVCDGLDGLYPGALADWAAWEAGWGSPTSYEQFAGRQTGMYRAAAGLAPAAVRDVADVCCSRRFCFRRREWTVGGEHASGDGGLIPCLEPCGIFLEMARRVARLEREPAVNVSIRPSEWALLREGAGEGRVESGDGYRERMRGYVVQKLDRTEGLSGEEGAARH